MKAVAMYAEVCTPMAVATLALGLRFVARRMTKAHYSWDDLLAVFAYLFGVGYCAVIIVWIKDYGLGKKLEDGRQDISQTEKLEKSYLLLWWSTITYVSTLGFSKYTVLAFYWRVFRLSSIRIPIQILAALSIAWLVAQILMVTLQCIPVHAFWDLSLRDSKCHLSEDTFFFGQVLTHVILDLSILILPVIQVARMQLRLGQKIGVIALFGFGILTCVASILVLIECINYDPLSTEMPRDMARMLLFSAVEVSMSIVAGSLLLLRPIFRKLIPTIFSSSVHSESQPVSGSHPASKPMRMRTFSRNKDLDETSSTRQLADSDDGIQELNLSQHERGRCPRTHISSPWAKEHPDDGDYGDGIHVRNEMAVHVEHV